MSRNEKIYFKRNAAKYRRKGGNQYIDLFDAIEAQELYDEAALIKKFKGRDFIRQLSAMKKYLYDSLMRSLVDQRMLKKVELQLMQMKAESEILVERGLAKEGFLVLKKAQKKALEWDHTSLYIDLLITENRLLANRSDRSRAEIMDFFNEMKIAVNSLRNAVNYLDLNEAFLYWHQRERSLRDETAMSELNNLMQEELLQAMPKHATFLSQLLFNSIQEKYHSLHNRTEDVLKWSAQNFSLYDKYPQMKEQNELNYFVTWIGYLNNLYRLKLINRLGEELKTFKLFKPKQPTVRNFHFSRYCGLKLSYIELSADFRSFDDIVKEVEAAIDSSKYASLPVTEWRLLYFNLTKLLIMKGSYQAAQEYCIRLLQLPETNHQSDLQRIGALLELLIHYKLGNIRLIEYLNQSIKRQMSKKKELYDYERTFSRLFKKLVEIGPFDRKSQLKKFKKEFNLLKEKEANVFEYFDLELWVEAELKKSTMVKLFKDRTL